MGNKNCKKDFKKCTDDNKNLCQCKIDVINLNIQITNKSTIIENITINISTRDKEIIDLRSKITILMLELKNCKTDYEKQIIELNITIHNLQITIKTCEAGNSSLTLEGNKCTIIKKECKANVTKLEATIVILNQRIIVLQTQLEVCNKSKGDFTIEINKYILIIKNLKEDAKKCKVKEETCTTQLNIKIKYITTIIEEHKIEITICQNKCNKNCEEENFFKKKPLKKKKKKKKKKK